jgi:hypothetical protein
MALLVTLGSAKLSFRRIEYQADFGMAVVYP